MARRYTTYWGGKARYSGGLEGGWPGTGGNSPLIIPTDTCVVHFHSDNENEKWGFRLHASAPAADSVVAQVQAACDSQALEPPTALRALVASCNNDADAALRCIRNGDVVRGATTCDEDSKSTSFGVFTSSDGRVEVSLQTLEVSLRHKLLVPVPAEVEQHRDFKAMFDLAKPMCRITATKRACREYAVLHQGRQYHLQAWKAPIAGSCVFLAVRRVEPMCCVLTTRLLQVTSLRLSVGQPVCLGAVPVVCADTSVLMRRLRVTLRAIRRVLGRPVAKEQRCCDILRRNVPNRVSVCVLARCPACGGGCVTWGGVCR